jgi:tRNA(Arg) A34 adenosine deaminase TadA
MRLAIEASRRALSNGNMPFGAVLVRDGNILHVAGNDQITSGDCTGHAETVLLREASMKHGRAALTGSTVYASGEPCAMCSGAIFWAGVSRVVFAATTADINSILGSPTLVVRCNDILSGATPSVRVEGPLLRAEAVAVLRSRPPQH